jgi:hypothetical protein
MGSVRVLASRVLSTQVLAIIVEQLKSENFMIREATLVYFMPILDSFQPPHGESCK